MAKRRDYLHWLWLWAALLSAPALPAAESGIEKLQAFLHSTTTLVAEFEQVSLDEYGATRQKSRGMFYLQRPGKFRWSYTQPYEQDVVSDGNKVWYYDADLDQVTVKRMDKALGSTPALLLSGDVALDTDFVLADQGRFEGLSWVKLLPKSEDSSYQYILIGMDEHSIGGMELSDNFGQYTRIYFSNLQINVDVDPSRFEFKAPPGVDVFDDS